MFKTHRCHKKEFLLKFAKDRECWLHWLFEAKKRYGLCILNYVVTSNYVHLLVKNTGKNVIPQSMQLIAGRAAQEYNLRKGRKGAYWKIVIMTRPYNRMITYSDVWPILILIWLGPG